MSAEFAIDLLRRGVFLAVLVAGPMLATALVVGFFVSLVQAVTQIQEQTLTFIPKLVLIGVVFIMTLPWIVTRLVQFVIGSLNNLGVLTS